MQNLVIGPGAKLTLAGHGLTVNGTLTNPGTVVLDGNEPITLAKGNDTIEGTWEYVGDNIGSTITLCDFGAKDYFNLVIDDTNAHPDTFQASAALSVKGTLTVMAGTFEATWAAEALEALDIAGGTFLGSAGAVNVGNVTISGGTLTAPAMLEVSGNWNNTGGTFNANGGTVVLDGALQHVNGSTTFFNLTKMATVADTLTFQAGATQTIDGTLTLEGSSGKLLALRSSVPGKSWDLDPLDAALLSFLDVEDARNLGSTLLTAAHSHNSGRNTRWSFPA